MPEDEPPFLKIIWNDSFLESLALLDLDDSFSHDVELGLEWRIRREVTWMDESSKGLEVTKLFGNPPLRAFYRYTHDPRSAEFFWIEEDPNPTGEDDVPF